MTPPIENQTSKTEDERATGLPLLTSWPAVYAAVLSFFVLLVILLTILTRAFA
jgi:hypothetical protein